MSITPNTATTNDPESLMTEAITEMVAVANDLAHTAASLMSDYRNGKGPKQVEGKTKRLSELGASASSLSQNITSVFEALAAENYMRPQHLTTGDRFLDPHSGEWLTVTDTPSPSFVDPTKTMVPVDRACDDIDSDPFVLIPTFGQVEVQA